MKTKLSISYICVGDLGPVNACSLVGGLVSVSPHGPQLVDSVGLLVEFLSPLGPFFLPPTCFPRLLELCLMFGCGSLHLFQSASGWSHALLATRSPRFNTGSF